MFCIALVKTQRVPIGVSPSFTALCSQVVFAFIPCTFQLHCFFTYFRRKRCTCHTVVVNLIVIGHFCRTWFFHCWSRFESLQTANSSQRLPQPKYHCDNTVLSNMTPTIQLGEVTVNVFTIRDERPPTVDIRHQNRLTFRHCVHSSSQQSRLAFRVEM